MALVTVSLGQKRWRVVLDDEAVEYLSQCEPSAPRRKALQTFKERCNHIVACAHKGETPTKFCTIDTLCVEQLIANDVIIGDAATLLVQELEGWMEATQQLADHSSHHMENLALILEPTIRCKTKKEYGEELQTNLDPIRGFNEEERNVVCLCLQVLEAGKPIGSKHAIARSLKNYKDDVLVGKLGVSEEVLQTKALFCSQVLARIWNKE